jgi:hypothetical protein
MYALDQVQDLPTLFDTEITVSTLTIHVAKIELARRNRTSFRGGGIYGPPSDAEGNVVVQSYDPHHMHHCIGQKLVKQTLTQTAAGATSKESVLPLSRLLEAARRTGNKTLINICERNLDLHSHAATRYALTNAEHRRALKELGYHFDAFILKTLADSIEAWHMPQFD